MLESRLPVHKDHLGVDRARDTLLAFRNSNVRLILRDQTLSALRWIILGLCTPLSLILRRTWRLAPAARSQAVADGMTPKQWLMHISKKGGTAVVSRLFSPAKRSHTWAVSHPQSHLTLLLSFFVVTVRSPLSHQVAVIIQLASFKHNMNTSPM